MRLNDNQKLAFLHLIYPQRKLLFGKINNKVTAKEKEKAWLKIIDDCQTIHGFNIVPNGKDWTYVRDKVFGNIKEATIKKRDQRSQTGGGGDSDNGYSEVDNAIFDIIGRNSAAINGLPVNQQWEEPEDFRDHSQPRENLSTAASIAGSRRVSLNSQSVASGARHSSESDQSSGNESDDQYPNRIEANPRRKGGKSKQMAVQEYRSLKRKYYELNIQYMRSNIEKLDLEKEKLRLEIDYLKKQKGEEDS